MKNHFVRGYEAVEKQIEASEKAKEMFGSKLFRFYVKKGEKEVDVIFLTDEPITFSEFVIPVTRNGKQFYDSILATPNSKYASEYKPQFKGAYLVYDLSEYEKDGVTKQAGLRLYVTGQTNLSQIERIFTKYPPLLNRQITIVKAGSGKSTSYSFDRGDVLDLSEEDIKDMIPEALQDQYDGTQESLMQMVEAQILMYAEEDSEEGEEPTAKKKTGVKSYSKAVIGVEDEEEKQIEPKRKIFSASKKKPKENQAKSLIAKRGNKS